MELGYICDQRKNKKSVDVILIPFDRTFQSDQDVIPELASFMKANEMDGTKSVQFVFANSPPEGPQTLKSNHRNYRC